VEFIATGISHKTSSIDLREQYFLSPHERELLLTELKCEPAVVEALVISTCNRTEIYALMSVADEELLRYRLCSVKRITSTKNIHRHFYSYRGVQAVEHLFQVSTGLDSLVLGEKQILGQLKASVELAREKQMLGRYFNILTNIVLRAGKKARSETAIDRGGSSISWAAVEMAKRHVKTLQDKSVLIVGAGKMSHLAASDLYRKGVSKLYVMNRTKDKGDDLASQFQAESVGFWEIKNILQHVDVCICSASAPHYLIEKDLIQEIMTQRQKELVFVDISMPRNIHPGVAHIDNVTLISLDELDKVIEGNIQQRQGAVDLVKKIIEQKVQEFYRKIDKATTLLEYGENQVTENVLT